MKTIDKREKEITVREGGTSWTFATQRDADKQAAEFSDAVPVDSVPPQPIPAWSVEPTKEQQIKQASIAARILDFVA